MQRAADKSEYLPIVSAMAPTRTVVWLLETIQDDRLRSDSP